MKIIILLLAVMVMACNNGSDQKKVYQDSANMMLDSLDKYKPGVMPDSNEIIRKNKYIMYKIMYDYYKDKSKQ